MICSGFNQKNFLVNKMADRRENLVTQLGEKTKASTAKKQQQIDTAINTKVSPQFDEHGNQIDTLGKKHKKNKSAIGELKKEVNELKTALAVQTEKNKKLKEFVQSKFTN